MTALQSTVSAKRAMLKGRVLAILLMRSGSVRCVLGVVVQIEVRMTKSTWTVFINAPSDMKLSHFFRAIIRIPSSMRVNAFPGLQCVSVMWGVAFNHSLRPNGNNGTRPARYQ